MDELVYDSPIKKAGTFMKGPIRDYNDSCNFKESYEHLPFCVGIRSEKSLSEVCASFVDVDKWRTREKGLRRCEHHGIARLSRKAETRREGGSQVHWFGFYSRHPRKTGQPEQQHSTGKILPPVAGADKDNVQARTIVVPSHAYHTTASAAVTRNLTGAAQAAAAAPAPEFYEQEDVSTLAVVEADRVRAAYIQAGQVVAQSFLTISDARLKEDIRSLTDETGSSIVEKFARIGAYVYTYKNELSGADNKEHIGLLAQEVLREFPQAVICGSDGYMAVDYSQMIAPLIAVINELSRGLDGIQQTQVEQAATINTHSVLIEENRHAINTLKEQQFQSAQIFKYAYDIPAGAADTSSVLVEHIICELKQSQHRRVWFHGERGMRKSVVAQLVGRQWEQQQHSCVLRHYTNTVSTKTTSAIFAVSSLIRQAVLATSGKHVEDQLEDSKPDRIQDLCRQLENTLRLFAGKSALVVFDCLDELNAVDVDCNRALMEALGSMSLPPNVYMLLVNASQPLDAATAELVLVDCVANRHAFFVMAEAMLTRLGVALSVATQLFESLNGNLRILGMLTELTSTWVQEGTLSDERERRLRDIQNCDHVMMDYIFSACEKASESRELAFQAVRVLATVGSAVSKEVFLAILRLLHTDEYGIGEREAQTVLDAIRTLLAQPSDSGICLSKQLLHWIRKEKRQDDGKRSHARWRDILMDNRRLFIHDRIAKFCTEAHAKWVDEIFAAYAASGQFRPLRGLFHALLDAGRASFENLRLLVRCHCQASKLDDLGKDLEAGLSNDAVVRGRTNLHLASIIHNCGSYGSVHKSALLNVIEGQLEKLVVKDGCEIAVHKARIDAWSRAGNARKAYEIACAYIPTTNSARFVVSAFLAVVNFTEEVSSQNREAIVKLPEPDPTSPTRLKDTIELCRALSRAGSAQRILDLIEKQPVGSNSYHNLYSSAVNSCGIKKGKEILEAMRAKHHSSDAAECHMLKKYSTCAFSDNRHAKELVAPGKCVDAVQDLLEQSDQWTSEKWNSIPSVAELKSLIETKLGGSCPTQLTEYFGFKQNEHRNKLKVQTVFSQFDSTLKHKPEAVRWYLASLTLEEALQYVEEKIPVGYSSMDDLLIAVMQLVPRKGVRDSCANRQIERIEQLIQLHGVRDGCSVKFDEARLELYSKRSFDIVSEIFKRRPCAEWTKRGIESMLFAYAEHCGDAAAGKQLELLTAAVRNGIPKLRMSHYLGAGCIWRTVLRIRWGVLSGVRNLLQNLTSCLQIGRRSNPG
eukprot:TRINITY_DN5931_c0_g1_i2.p1 TRINITY_DN5931_c0_g1~~TRINITY_DN5931_c0_g1_i2.p1  ORF type:complete len:1266 (+),score=261.70 TRINITY_DN5931_c0_g1_i2:58-3855(+)